MNNSVSPNRQQPSLTRQKKEETVERLTEALQRAKTTIFANYRGLSMNKLQQLRAQLGQSGATLTVTKNTLLKRALDAADRSGYTPDVLEGPTATMFGFEDELAPLKVLAAFAEVNQLPTVKGGFLEAEFLPAPRLEQLARLPGRQELYAQLVRGVSAPLYGLINVLQGNMRNLVYVLSRVQKQKAG